MVIQRHRLHAQFAAQPTHRERFEPLVVGKLDRGFLVGNLDGDLVGRFLVELDLVDVMTDLDADCDHRYTSISRFGLD